MGDGFVAQSSMEEEEAARRSLEENGLGEAL